MSRGNKKGNVHFLGVGRTIDQVLVASQSYNSDVDLAVVEQTMAQPNVRSVTPDKLCSFTAAGMIWWLQKDSTELIFLLTTKTDYPTHAAMNCLKELQMEFVGQFGPQASSCSARGLTRRSASLMKGLCQKYDNLEEVDQLTRVAGKLESTKLVMQENMQLALANCVKLEDITVAAENLAVQSNMFASNAKELERKMWWKQCKMKIMIAVIVTIILGVIIAIIAVQVESAKNR
mmetsp:Transcript_1309/g.2025  ORF Transcript_1309/g.2025 Transcript_1309/m.2025 type:complete len:233 (-) Transcript_1309:203-901(-)